MNYTQQPKKKIKFGKEKEEEKDFSCYTKVSKCFQVFFKNNITQTLDIKSDDTIAFVKQKISEKVTLKSCYLLYIFY
jgi:hypothetical protein